MRVLAAAAVLALSGLVGGCGTGSPAVRTSKPAAPASGTQTVDYNVRPFCGLRPGSYTRPGANAYAFALVAENRQYQGFEDMERTEGTDLARVRERLTAERAQVASFIGDVQALPVAPENAPLIDALVNAKRQMLDLLDKEVAAPSMHEINLYQAAVDGIETAGSTASRELRHALGLPATTCQYLF